MNLLKNKLASGLFFLFLAVSSHAQIYPAGVIDKTVAVIGGEMVAISDIENEIMMMRAQGSGSDKNIRCEVLEQIMQGKIFLMQARIDSVVVNNDMVEAELSQRMDQVRTQLGGDEQAEAYFGKPMYKLRQEWRESFKEQTLMQQERQKIASNMPQITPWDVQQYMDKMDPEDLPIIPVKYQISQICVYPDRKAAGLAVKERLLAIRERIINGERFSTMARLYSQDPGSARRGGELGMASKSIFWPEFSDAAMSLKPGIVSQIVETPDGYHLIEVLERKGDMFNARHILLKPEYSSDDREIAFARLDTLRTKIAEGILTFDNAARFFSEDPSTRTNGGQVSDPTTGSSYFEIDKLKPQDYSAIRGLKEGEISHPIESVDNEGRGNTIYKIIRVDKILPAHTATFAHDYDRLMAEVKAEKQIEAVKSFIDSKIDVTHIIIDPIFADCDFENPKWSTKVRKD